MSLFDKMKDKLQSAGKEAQKLTKMGQLKLDLREATSALDGRHRDLGKACAARFLDQDAATVAADDTAIQHCLQLLAHARQRVLEVNAAIEELREQYRDLEAVTAYLQRVQADIIENIVVFRTGANAGGPMAALQQAMGGLDDGAREAERRAQGEHDRRGLLAGRVRRDPVPARGPRAGVA